MVSLPYLTPTSQSCGPLPFGYDKIKELRQLFGEDLCEWDGDFEEPSVSAGYYLGREWFVVDTAFGRKYLVLADMKGGFILLPMRADMKGVTVVFDRPVDESDRPSRHDDTTDPVPSRKRLQYLTFFAIAAALLAQEEQV